MVAVIDTSVASKTSRAGILALALEPVRAGAGIETLWFGPGQHLVGSAPECSHALRSGGIQPRHCEIRLDSGRATLRALDFRTWLNNGPVRQAELRDGDRLTVGPLEFRICLRTNSEALDATSESTDSDELWSANPQQAISTSPQAPIVPIKDHQHYAEMEARLAQLEANLNERDSEIESRAQAIAALEGDLAGRSGRLREQESAMARQSAIVDAHESALHQAQAALEAQQREIDERLQRAARTIAACDKSQPLLAIDPEIAERERVLDQREASLSQRDSVLKRRETALGQRESAFSERQVAIEQQESTSDARIAALDDRESAIVRRETALRGRDGVIGQRESALGERENQLKQRESNLAQRKLELDERTPALDERETRLAERQIVVEHRERKLADREAMLHALEQDRARLDAQAAQCAQGHASREQALDAREKQIAKQFAQITQRETEADVRFAELVMREAALHSQPASIAADPAELQSLRDSLEAEQADRKQEQLRFESEKTTLAASLAKVEREVRTLEIRARDFEQRRKSLEQECEKLRTERASARTKAATDEALVPSYPVTVSLKESAPTATESTQKSHGAAKTENIGSARIQSKTGEVRPKSVISVASAPALKADEQPMHLQDATDADSVAAYMEQLLARNKRGKTDGEVCWLNSPQQIATAALRKESIDANHSSKPEQPEASSEGAEHYATPKPLPGPSHKQDRTVARADLDSLRHVANSAARSAIAKYSSKASREKFLFRGLLLTMSFTLGTVLLLSSTWGSGNYAKFGWLALASCAALGADLLLRSSQRARKYSPGPGTVPLKKPAATPRVHSEHDERQKNGSTVAEQTNPPVLPTNPVTPADCGSQSTTSPA